MFADPSDESERGALSRLLTIYHFHVAKEKAAAACRLILMNHVSGLACPINDGPLFVIEGTRILEDCAGFHDHEGVDVCFEYVILSMPQWQ